MIGCIIQARIGSKRLPEKILKKLDEKTVLDYVIEQTKYSKKIEKIFVATTNFLPNMSPNSPCKYTLRCIAINSSYILFPKRV